MALARVKTTAFPSFSWECRLPHWLGYRMPHPHQPDSPSAIKNRPMTVHEKFALDEGEVADFLIRQNFLLKAIRTWRIGLKSYCVNQAPRRRQGCASAYEIETTRRNERGRQLMRQPTSPVFVTVFQFLKSWFHRNRATSNEFAGESVTRIPAKRVPQIRTTRQSN